MWRSVVVVRFSNVFALISDLLLECCFVLLQSTFLHVATGDQASLEFIKFSGGSLFGFENKLDGDNEFLLVRLFTKDEGSVINEVLNFNLDSMKPGCTNIISITFEDSFEELRFRKVLVDRVIICWWVIRFTMGSINGHHHYVDGIN